MPSYGPTQCDLNVVCSSEQADVDDEFEKSTPSKEYALSR